MVWSSIRVSVGGITIRDTLAQTFEDAAPAVRVLTGAFAVDKSVYEAMLYAMLRPGASLATLRRRATYGGRKGQRAARRLRAAGVTP